MTTPILKRTVGTPTERLATCVDCPWRAEPFQKQGQAARNHSREARHRTVFHVERTVHYGPRPPSPAS